MTVENIFRIFWSCFFSADLHLVFQNQQNVVIGTKFKVDWNLYKTLQSAFSRLYLCIMVPFDLGMVFKIQRLTLVR